MKNTDHLYFQFNWKSCQKYILCQSIEHDYLKQAILEYSELLKLEQSQQEHRFRYYYKKDKSDWVVIKCPDEISFYVFHNLLGWIAAVPNCQSQWPKQAIGVVVSEEMGYSYYCHLDRRNPYQDSLIGTFDDGKTFQISLPDAFQENGNIMLFDVVNSQTKLWLFLKDRQIERTDLEVLPTKWEWGVRVNFPI